MDVIIQPFANSGNVTAPPQTDPNDFVNWTLGYTSDYEINLASGNPQAKGVERAVQNYMFNLLTTIGKAWQQAGIPPWLAIPGGYQKNVVVIRQNGSSVWVPYRSLVAGNTTDPLTSPTSWEYVQSSGEMLKNIPMPAGGSGGSSAELVSAATDFNTFTTGTFEFSSDAVTSGSPNSPSSLAGMLEIKQWGTNIAVQRFLDRSGTVYARGYLAGTWTAWNELCTVAQLYAALGGYVGVASYSASATLTAAQAGYAIKWVGTSVGALTLPLVSTLAQLGNSFHIYNDGSAAVTVQVNASATEQINYPPLSNTSTFTIPPGGDVKFVAVLQAASPVKAQWDMASGSAIAQVIPLPVANATANAHAMNLGQFLAGLWEVSGAVTFDALITASGGVAMPNNTAAIKAKNTGGTLYNLTYIDAANNSVFGNTTLNTVVNGLTLTINGATTFANAATFNGQIAANAGVVVPNNTGYQAKVTGGTAYSILYMSSANVVTLGLGGIGLNLIGSAIAVTGPTTFANQAGFTSGAQLANNVALTGLSTGAGVYNITYIDGANNLQLGNTSLPTYVQGTSVTVPSVLLANTGVRVPNNVGYTCLTSGGGVLPVAYIDAGNISHFGNTSTYAQIDSANGVILNTKATASTHAMRSDQTFGGVGQAWTSVARSYGTTYTNSTGRPIIVNCITSTTTGAGSMGGYQNGNEIVNNNGYTGGLAMCTFMIVPAGSSFAWVQTGAISGTATFLEYS